MVEEAGSATYQLPTTGALRQGEIVSGLVEPVPTTARGDSGGAIPVDLITHPFAVVLTQDCDLERDFAARQSVDASAALRSILFCEAIAENAFRAKLPPGGDIWKTVRQNKHERYMLLRAVAPELDAAGEGVSALGIDFRRHFTLSPAVVYEQIGSGMNRRVVLRDVYAAHLSSRFAYFLARVGLPVDHHV